jgi:peroxiredoxin (alkyl hydroperoxide reductase subunit C)
MKFILPSKPTVELKVVTILADTNRNLSNILGILDIDSTEYSEETDSVMIEGSNVTLRINLIDETGKIFHESKRYASWSQQQNIYGIQEKGEVCPQTGKLEKSNER